MIILICGWPRAGKTTYSKQFEKGYRIISLDKCGTYDRVLQEIHNTKKDIVIDGIYNISNSRKKILDIYRGKGERKCIWLDTSLEIRKKRIGYIRLHEYPFEPPTYDEGWDEIYIIKDNGEPQLLPKS